MSIRKACVNGTFYPANKDEIQRYINHFNQVLEDINIDNNCDFTPKAIISPHAGYIYSGFTANIVYELIKEKVAPKRLVVIGPSHKFAFNGASISFHDSYETPLGNLDIDWQYSKYLEEKYQFLEFNEMVHQEHSTETQMPFIKYYFPNTKVVEIIYSDCDYINISNLISEVLKDKDNFVVISTDLSHFYTLENAHKKDNICLNAITNLDLDIFNQGCEACGLTGVKAIVDYAKRSDFKVKLLDYRTSADASNDKSSVVGYTSFVLGK